MMSHGREFHKTMGPFDSLREGLETSFQRTPAVPTHERIPAGLLPLVLLVAAFLSSSRGYALEEAPNDDGTFQNTLDLYTPGESSLESTGPKSMPGALPGTPGVCGCDPLPQNYPDYQVQYSVWDEETEEWDDKTVHVSGSTLETAHFAIHYPSSASHSPASGGNTVHTDCRWDWGMGDTRNFGQSGYQIDCSAEDQVAHVAAEVLELVWEVEIGMGYPEPPLPGGRMDVYIGDLSAMLGVDETGVAEPCADGTSGGPTNSRLFLDRSLSENSAMTDIVAHEFFHTVQNGIDHKEGLAWREATATWMQMVVTGRSSWGYEAWGIEHYDQPLTDVDPWQLRFGNAIWPQYLAAHYGEEILLDIWLDATAPTGDDGTDHAFDILNRGIDGYAAAIHQFRYGLWAERGAPETERIALSGSSSEVSSEGVLEDTTATYILFEGDPSRSDGRFKICFENPDDKLGLWARLAVPGIEAASSTTRSVRGALPFRPDRAPDSQEAGVGADARLAQAIAPGSTTAENNGSTGLENGETVLATVSVPDPFETSYRKSDWTCDGARSLGTAPSGYILPFSGHMIITNGPGEGMHTGASIQAVDYAPQGGGSWPVLAVAGGTVVDVVTVSDFGTVVRIEHDGGLISFYAHLDTGAVKVEADEPVKQGQVIAMAGNTGNGEGYHLHFEVRQGWSSSVYSGSSVDIRGLYGSMWCTWYPPGDPDLYSGYADSSGVPLTLDSATFLSEGPPLDNTELPAGETFTKTWTFLNSGSTTWLPSTYYAGMTSGAFGPTAISFKHEVPPGDSITLEADYTVPEAPGTYNATYRMTGPNGPFGDPFWVQIVALPYGEDDAELLSEGPPEPDTGFMPGESFTKQWTLRNTGTSTWGTSSHRAWRSSGIFGPAFIDLPGGVAPSERVTLSAPFMAPSAAGTYEATYRMEGRYGAFGDVFSVRIVVYGIGVLGIDASEIHEVGLDLQDPDCPGGYMEIDSFGVEVPWVALIVTFAGDSGSSDLCTGHGAYAMCGLREDNPPCGSAPFRYSAKVEYPESSTMSCSIGTLEGASSFDGASSFEGAFSSGVGRRGRSSLPAGLLLLVLSVGLCRARRVARRSGP